MKKIIYLNFNLDNPSDLELYTLLENLGRNKKSIIKLAMMQSGMLSGNACTPVRVPKLNSKKKVPAKKNESINVDSASQSVPSIEKELSPESVAIGPTVEERPVTVGHQSEQYDSVPESVDTQTDFPQAGQRYFTKEQIEVIKQLPNVNISSFENELFCQVMAEELGSSTDRNAVRDAYTEASWS